MDQCAVCQPATIQIEPELTLLAIEAVRTVCLPVNTEFLQTVVGFLLQCCVMLFRRCVLSDDEARLRRQHDVIQRPGLDLIRPARRDGVEDLAARAVCVLHGVDQGIGGVFQLEDSALERFPVLIELLQRQGDSPTRVGEYDLIEHVLDQHARGVRSCADHTVDRVCHAVAAVVSFFEAVLHADRKVLELDVFARLEREGLAAGEQQFLVCVDPNAVRVKAVVGEGTGRAEGRLERKVLGRVAFADHFLADRQISRRLLERNARDGRQREVHVACGTGCAAFRVEDRQRMRFGLCAFFPIDFVDIIPQIDVLADRRMDTADVADKLLIEEDPHIVVTEECVFQRPHIVRRQREFNGVLHPEVGVVRPAVVARRKDARFFCFGFKGKFILI